MIESNRALIVVDPTTDAEQDGVTRGAGIAARLDLGVELLICNYEQFLSQHCWPRN